MNEGAPESSSHGNFFVLGSPNPLRSDKVSATPELDTSRATEELQEVVLGDSADGNPPAGSAVR